MSRLPLRPVSTTSSLSLYLYISLSLVLHRHTPSSPFHHYTTACFKFNTQPKCLAPIPSATQKASETVAQELFTSPSNPGRPAPPPHPTEPLWIHPPAKWQDIVDTDTTGHLPGTRTPPTPSTLMTNIVATSTDTAQANARTLGLSDITTIVFWALGILVVWVVIDMRKQARLWGQRQQMQMMGTQVRDDEDGSVAEEDNSDVIFDSDVIAASMSANSAACFLRQKVDRTHCH